MPRMLCNRPHRTISGLHETAIGTIPDCSLNRSSLLFHQLSYWSSSWDLRLVWSTGVTFVKTCTILSPILPIITRHRPRGSSSGFGSLKCLVLNQLRNPHSWCLKVSRDAVGWMAFYSPPIIGGQQLLNNTYSTSLTPLQGSRPYPTLHIIHYRRTGVPLRLLSSLLS